MPALIHWYNFRTGEYETLTQVPAEFQDYIPQDPSAQGLYIVLTEGESVTPMDAVERVLSAVCGRKAERRGVKCYR